MGGKQHSRKGRAKSKRSTKASRADLHDLYERSVQSPESDCELFATIYEELRAATALVLREDFCGTAQLSLTWCLEDDQRRAIGVDLDSETLAWARSRNLEPNAEALGDRIELIQGDVLEVDNGEIAKADIVAALNFSFCVFKERHELKRYFEQIHASLNDRGVVFLEMFGGLTAIDTDEEIRELDDFTYIWEQASFNPINNDIVCHIHFEFDDGSKIDKAFTYEWRLWSLPELRDLLYEAGFSNVRVYWEKVEDEDADEEEDDDAEVGGGGDDEEDEEDDDDDDDDDEMLEGTGEYEEVEIVEQQDSWLVYVVGEK